MEVGTGPLPPSNSLMVDLNRTLSPLEALSNIKMAEPSTVLLFYRAVLGLTGLAAPGCECQVDGKTPGVGRADVRLSVRTDRLDIASNDSDGEPMRLDTRWRG